MNFLFNADTLKSTGFNRDKMPFEREIKNVDIVKPNNIENLNYADILEKKRLRLIEQDLLLNGLLFEIFPEDMFDKTHANMGFDFISFSPNHEVVTNKLQLPMNSNVIRVYLETNISGLNVEVGEEYDSFMEVNQYNEVYFQTAVSEIVVRISNPTLKTIEVSSFGLLLG